MKYTCNLCNYNSNNITHYNRHCNTISHLNKEELNIFCYKCNKKFKTKTSYKTHKYNYHSTTINKNNKNNKNNYKISIETETQIIIKQVKHEINESNKQVKEEIKEEIQNSKKEVVTVVNKAITKASSLIKYLMENHRSVPPLKKITKNQCIPILRLDYNCPEKDGDYSLQKLFRTKFRIY
jgi:hypothetical protein